MTNRYEVFVAKSKDLTPSVMRMIYDAGVSVTGKYPGKQFGAWKRFPYKKWADHPNGLIILCLRNGEAVGILIAQKGKAFFGDTVILRQETLYAKPGTRAAYYLLKHFIDIGRATADHVITMIGDKTNIKPESLKKLGFKEMETLYCLED